MSKYRTSLPQLQGGTYLADGGMETTLIFHNGLDLPQFASFVLLADPDGRRHLEDYYRPYLEIARRHGTGFVLDTPTWRANPDWGLLLGYDAGQLRAMNRDAVLLTCALREEYDSDEAPVVVSGAIGPRGDGYLAGQMDEEAAEDYHATQICWFAETDVDVVSAYTLTSVPEAIGIARAARAAGVPSSISFTVETDGRLVTGPTIAEAITAVDEATDAAPAYYMVNCAHPAHFTGQLEGDGAWRERLFGIRANASTKSHAELDASETLDAGDPVDLGGHYRGLKASLPSLRIMGGCCGTDHRHIAAICEACFASPAA